MMSIGKKKHVQRKTAAAEVLVLQLIQNTANHSDKHRSKKTTDKSHKFPSIYCRSDRPV